MQRPTLTVLILLGAVALVGWLQPHVLLIVFAGILCSVALRGGAVPIGRRLGIGEGWGLLVVALLVLVAFGALVWFSAQALAEQFRQFSQDLPGAWERAKATVQQMPLAEWVLDAVPVDQLKPSPEMAANLARIGVGGTFGALGNLALILLLGLYIAGDPRPYRRGALRLFSPELRVRAARTMNEATEALRGWLLGQLVGMTFEGVAVFIGLWLLGIPLAALLAVLVAIFSFIPYLGPILGAVPAILMALAQDPSLVPWVIALFVVVQGFEGNVLTPLVQSKSADMPPAILLATQALLGTGLGFIGILLAAPIAAAALAAVRVGYVESWVEAEAEEAKPKAEGPPQGAA